MILLKTRCKKKENIYPITTKVHFIQKLKKSDSGPGSRKSWSGHRQSQETSRESFADTPQRAAALPSDALGSGTAEDHPFAAASGRVMVSQPWEETFPSVMQ